MDFISIFLVAISLAMDAFAVSICNGIAIKNVKIGHATAFGLMFGGFQFVMPVAGYFLGSSFSVYIKKYDHWIAFALLAFIGGKCWQKHSKEKMKMKLQRFNKLYHLASFFHLGLPQA